MTQIKFLKPKLQTDAQFIFKNQHASISKCRPLCFVHANAKSEVTKHKLSFKTAK